MSWVKPALFLPKHFPLEKAFQGAAFEPNPVTLDRVLPAAHPVSRDVLSTRLLSALKGVHFFLAQSITRSLSRAPPWSSNPSLPLSNSSWRSVAAGMGMNRSWPSSPITYAEYVPDCGLAMDA